MRDMGTVPDIATQEKRVTVHAVVLRRDGRREELGVIATNDPDGPGVVRTAELETTEEA